MPSFKTFAQGASTLAFALATLATPALAVDQNLEGAKSINVELAGAVPVVTVRNVDITHRLSDLDLAIKEQQIAVPVGAQVECLGTTSENWKWRHGYALGGGAFGIGRTTLLMQQALTSSSSIDHVGDADSRAFQMPPALLANPQIAIDPLAEVLAAADQAPNKIAWLRKDHVITVKIPLRLEAQCNTYSRNKLIKKTVYEGSGPGEFNAYVTRDVDLKIKYEGDPQLFELNAQIAQGGGLANQLNSTPQPFEITSMQFQPNLPTHVGACPKMVPMRVKYTGEGQGDLRIRIAFGNTPEHESQVMAFDSKNGPQHYDFELETPYIQNNNINNTIQYNLRVFVRGKGAGEQSWTSYQLMDSAVWKVRCTPKLNPVLGGGAVGGTKQYGTAGNGGSRLTPTLKVQPVEPVDPTPSRPKRAD